MKRTNFILFALFLILSSGQLWAQEKALPYKPAAAFKGDTLRYLEYNYAKRSAQYVGLTVGDILKELEYPVLYVQEAVQWNPKTSITQVARLYLVIREVNRASSETQDYYISVNLEDTPAFDGYREASGYNENNHNPAFSQKLYDFIKDLKISSVYTNTFILKDPEIKAAWLQHHQQQREKILNDLEKAGMKKEEAEKIRQNFQRSRSE
jgi:hypothetical protein